MKLSLLLTIFLLTASAGALSETLGTFKQGSTIELKQICADCTYNNITRINYPNSSIAISDVQMTQMGSYFNYSFSDTNTVGRYIVNGIGDLGGVNTVWTYYFDVNPSGIEPTDQRTSATTRATWFLFGVATLLLLGSFFFAIATPYRLTMVIIGFMFLLIGVNVIFVSLNDEVVNPKLVNLFDNITAVTFYLFWFCLTLIFVLWIFTFFVTVMDKKSLRQSQKYGDNTLWAG